MNALFGIVLAPLVPGVIQALKARLQGRRGPSALQPYRTLKRLWGKSAIDVAGAGAVYRCAPALVAACLLAALALLPGPDFGLGHDAFLLVGLLALARAALAAAAWDTGNGFALMGSARDLMLAVFGEALILLALLVAVDGTTDLAAMHAPDGPARWCGLLAFAIVVVAETGRQPVDNPDTHLELTMIHEGPLLEYGGRDLAYLQWAAAARHWIVLVLAGALYLPGPALAWVLPGCVALALLETTQAKLRILRAPALLGLGALIALAGIAL